jgi:uncharacterized protein YjdB
MKKLFLLFTMLAMVLISKAQTDLIISEYVEGWGTNKALEIYNPTNATINMSTYRVTRYSNGADTPPADVAWTFMLPNRNLLPYHSYVVVGDKRNPLGTGQEAPVWAQLAQRADTFACPDYAVSKTMYFNGNDAVSLEKQSGANWLIVDLFARYGAPAPALATLPGSATKIEAWTDVSPYFSGDGIALTADHTLIRKASVKNGITVNPALFNALAEWDTLSANTFINMGWHKFNGAPANSTPVLNLSKSLFFVNPAAANGTSIGTLSATDSEGDPIRYYVNYGNFVYVDDGNPTIPDKRYEPFGLDRTTGELTVVNNLGLLPAIKSMFYLETTVTDGLSQSESTDITIIVAEPVSVINIGPSGGSSITTFQGTLQFITEVFPAVTFDPTLRYTWKVSDESIASIDATGLVTAKKNGKVNVICAAVDGSGVEGVYELTITGQPLPVTGLTIYSATGGATITVDYATLQFTAEVEPSFSLDPETRFMWMVSDETIATISESGLLTPKGNGNVNVICMATDGSGVESQFPVSISNQTVSVSNQIIAPAIYPNPVEGKQFRISAANEIKSIVITDVASREVYRKSFKAGVLSTDVELSSDFKGVFMVTVIYSDNSRGVSKLVFR